MKYLIVIMLVAMPFILSAKEDAIMCEEGVWYTTWGYDPSQGNKDTRSKDADCLCPKGTKKEASREYLPGGGENESFVCKTPTS